jgi:acyl-CoA dehydrogenase
MPCDWIYPQTFSTAPQSDAARAYLDNPSTQKLAEFFEAKGPKTLKQEDERQQWYADWLAYQASHRLYFSVLGPTHTDDGGFAFDVLTYSRFLEVFGYYSPAHGYSLQVTSLGLFAVLGGCNPALKTEALATLERGGLLAFAVSEKDHGSDLLSNEFTVHELTLGRFVANGSKYYIGNANAASFIAILANKHHKRSSGASKRAIPILFALRPEQSKGFGGARKIGTLGIRGAFVGEFEVKDHEFPESDVIASGREAWDAVFAAITLGKFFLAFGSVGICQHALAEATAHLNHRILYGKPAIAMPHLRFAMAQVYARLTAMKLYAYRALDYVAAANEADRRYLLYCAVQKAKVSTEGVKVMAQLSECIGAKGFEADTYFEMALRDVQLFPGLEGSTHINLTLTAQFIPRYFDIASVELANPKSLSLAQETPQGNPYLFQARTGGINTILFSHCLASFKPLVAIPNVRLFAKQAKAFQLLLSKLPQNAAEKNVQADLALGQCLATIAYAQLVAENAVCLAVPAQIVSTIFHLLVNDLASNAMALASTGQFDGPAVQLFVRRTSLVPRTAAADWDFVARRLTAP